ncbi:RHS repeat protein [Escherichia sp. E1130]|uniref:RHS repeat-associated core domain-containing protein n=2 Tax=Escherichia sp. E1130 TaxID=2041645 RepID=UPI0014367485|nr:RHS repeat protein [Escherichia sp. E1130]
MNTTTDGADAVTVTALSGQPLSLHTADGDESLALGDAAGRPLWSRNAQDTVTTVRYEDAGEGGRPASLTEAAAGDAAGRERERYGYHPLTDEKVRARNQAGTTAEHYNNAGVTRPLSVSLSGQLLTTEQQLLKPEVGEPDWTRLSEGDPAAYLEAPLKVSGTYDATGAPLMQTNADSVTTVSEYDIRGAVIQTLLRYEGLAGPHEAITLQDILYRADGVVLSQTSGNGVTEKYTYDPQTQYLSRHTVSHPDDHPQGALLISDLHYAYDQAGNIITLEDRGTDPLWHNNQRVTGLREYAYDTLYRLTSATGRERHPVDPENPTAGYTWSPYTERYTYDDGDNLTQTVHTGGSGNRSVTMVVSQSSNRAVKKPDDSTTPAPDAGFLAGGLQKQLSDGRALSWHADSQLRQVSPVTRTGEGEQNDTERYHYADGGTRTRKIRTTQQSGGMQTSVTTYAGGTETRQHRLKDTLQLGIVITEGGGVRLVRDKLTGETHLRYSFSDHLGSTGGETDSTGKVTSREEYLPYGGSAGSVEEGTEVTNRTRRYSGKERDATGLLYYGWRYYQPETGRWLSADPGGLIDGVNLFRFCLDNPLNRVDIDGRNNAETDRINSLLRANYQNNVKIRILARREENRAGAMNKLAAQFKIQGQELGETLHKIIDYIDDAPRSINVKYSTLPNFTDDYIKNTFATQTRTENPYYINKRIGRNRELINFDAADDLLKEHHIHSALGMGVSGEINPVSHAAHPVHGSVQMQSLAPAQGGAYYEEYGESALFLNPESDSFSYLTYTPQDSMFFYIGYEREECTFPLPDAMAVRENMYPLVRYAREEQLQYYYDVAINNEVGKPAMKPYIEWQVHSRLKLGTDVHKLYVSENEKPKGMKALFDGTGRAVKAFARKHNIAIIN